MKNKKLQKIYNIVISNNGLSSSLMFSISERALRYTTFVFALTLFFLVLFVTDYFSLTVDHWKLQSLKKENKKLQNQFYEARNQLRDLEIEVHKLSDFSNKLKRITTASTSSSYSSNGYGKVSQSALLALSKFQGKRQLASQSQGQSFSKEDIKNASHNKTKPSLSQQALYNKPSLEPYIKNVKSKSEMLKQDVWNLYTELLDQKNFINNTPSITPAKDCWLSSPYGLRNEVGLADHHPYFHKGLDLACKIGEPVVATADGKVVYSGYDEFGYGNVVIVDHGYNLKTYYAHLFEIKAKVGQAVSRGEVIATVGNTGKSTGPHLHYEVRIFGNPVNPENYTLDAHDHYGVSL